MNRPRRTTRAMPRLLLVLLAAIMLLAACDNGGVTLDDTPAELQEETTGAIIRIRLPENWVAAFEEGSIFLEIANSDRALDGFSALDPEPPTLTGSQVVGVFVGPDFVAADGVLGGAETPTDLVEIAAVPGEDASADYGEIETYTQNERDGALIIGTVTDGETTYAALITAFEINEGFGILSFVAPEGQIAQYEDEIKAIAGTIEYTPGAISGFDAEAATAEPTGEATDEATPEATDEATPESTEEATPEATREGTPEATAEATEAG